MDSWAWLSKNFTFLALFRSEHSVHFFADSHLRKKLAASSTCARPSLCLSGVLRYSLLRIPQTTAGENKKFSGDNMKKLISVFAALALVGAVSAQAPAAKKGMGLRIGLGLGYTTSIANKSTDQAAMGSVAGGGGLEAGITNAGGTASGTGTSTSNSGIDSNLTLEYDILPWLFVRSGVGRANGLKNTYEGTRTLGGVTTTGTVTSTASQLEVPGLIGFNLLHTDRGSLYFAAGVAYVSADYTITASGTQAGTTFKDVETKLSATSLGLNWIVGGRVKIADNINIFGEVKFMSAAKAGVTIDTTKNDGTSTYATTNSVVTSIQTSNVFKAQVEAQADSKKSVSALDMSYTRWNVGVQYEM
jgi:hypothetical protein